MIVFTVSGYKVFKCMHLVGKGKHKHKLSGIVVAVTVVGVAGSAKPPPLDKKMACSAQLRGAHQRGF